MKEKHFTIKTHSSNFCVLIQLYGKEKKRKFQSEEKVNYTQEDTRNKFV